MIKTNWKKKNKKRKNNKKRNYKHQNKYKIILIKILIKLKTVNKIKQIKNHKL
jgi:hypothetical protein